ncbi:ATP-dependent zinc protease [Thalassotalea maritima]|uniref:ATP-dependent zinc protease family protein n=1 Tax=Thalassotalea maritima TaxID=3242416 RepID=UPI003528AF6C
MSDKMIIGHIENLDLPELGITQLTARVDTGAQTSSLHVDNIQRTQQDGKPAISFDIHPEIHNVDKTKRCTAVLIDVRKIKSSNAQVEQRYVIQTKAILAGYHWDIEITLTDRSDMTYLMLLGRQALRGHFLVDVSSPFIVSSQ